MFERTYKGVSLLATNYFKLLCAHAGITGTFDAIPEDLESDDSYRGQTYTISLSGLETYKLMQKVFEEQNS